MTVIRIVVAAAIGAGLGALVGVLVKLRGRDPDSKREWAFVGSPRTGAVFGAVVGIVFGLYFGGPYGWRTEEQSSVVPLTGETFKAALDGPKPLIAVFYSETCPTCHKLAPKIERLADEYEGRVTVAKVNAEAEAALSQRYDIRLYPTTIYFANGERTGMSEGVVSASALRQRADALLEKQAAPGKQTPDAKQPAEGATASDAGADDAPQ